MTNLVMKIQIKDLAVDLAEALMVASVALKIYSILSLAEAEEEQLLKLWEGLGYYNRVRNLQKAARTVMTEYGGKMPTSFDGYQKIYLNCIEILKRKF